MKSTRIKRNSDLHSPRWSLTTKASVMASRILNSLQLSGTTLAPSLKFLLRIQLELSVNSMSPITAAPPLIVTSTSPASNGRFPALSFTILLSNSSVDQFSRSPPGKSPSRTIISTLKEWDKALRIFWLSPLVSSIMSWRGLFSSFTILVPVNIGSERFLVKVSRMVDGSGAWIRKEGDLVKRHLRIPFSTSSTTWEYKKEIDK